MGRLHIADRLAAPGEIFFLGRYKLVDVALTLATVAGTRPPAGGAGEVLLEILGQ